MPQSKVIVVTGSTRGIGFGLARELLQRGQQVVISGRTDAACDKAVAALASAAAAGSGRVVGIACNVAERADLQRLWDRAVATFGRVDLWINNAGVSHDRERVGALPAADIRNVQETNLLGMMHATQIAMRGMQAQPDGGTIYNMEGYGSSGMTAPGMSLYGASKFALTYFNKALLSETKNSKVRICYLSPGIVVTDLLKRDLGDPNTPDYARMIRIYNILGDRVETVTPFLAEGVLADRPAGARVAWLTGGKAARRFFGSLFHKRKVLQPADLA
jgi:NAD(P)-dependent dehydrogenase (short-subunit alcohol dehydrogenase family)